MRKLQKFRDYHINKLKNLKDAKVYLEVALEEYEKDGETEAFLLALRDIAEAQGGLTALAKRTDLNRQNLYKALSPNGNPGFNTIGSIIHGLGFRLAIQRL